MMVSVYASIREYKMGDFYVSFPFFLYSGTDDVDNDVSDAYNIAPTVQKRDQLDGKLSMIYNKGTAVMAEIQEKAREMKSTRENYQEEIAELKKKLEEREVSGFHM